VHDGTYTIGHRTLQPDGTYRDDGIVTHRGWWTIDKVLDPNTHTFYSSKPPLFSTIVAGVYWVVRAVTGWSIIDDQLAVVWTILIIVNLVPFYLYCWLLGKVLEQFDVSDWARVYIFAAGCFGTFVTTFQVVLNNHTPAACAAMAALYFLIRTTLDSERRPAQWVGAGFFAGFTATLELPAASLLLGVAVWIWRRHGLRGALVVAASAAVPIAAWFVTNYLAVGQLHPVYAQVRSVWYLYDGSPWLSASLPGIERAGQVETKLDYAANLILGHHGLFSLTPVFLLVFGGLFVSYSHPHPVQGEAPPNAPQATLLTLNRLSWLAVSLTSAVTVFYVIQTSNYGGSTVGPRWFFWLTPLLLVAALPTVDILSASRSGRAFSGLLLAVSVLSASYHATHPWAHPWLYELLGYIDPPLQY
jgi:hypothetical protein